MRPVQNLSLRKSLVLYIVLFVMFALALSIMTASVCETVADKINEKYPNTGEKYYLTNEQGERLGEGTYIYKELPVLNEQDEQLLAILDLLPTVTPPIYSAFCIIAAALLFYKNKLKKPLAELRAASEKIANNDLDFSIDYDSNDELGQLCASFEIMRTTLADNFSKMWRQVEERKALNAAFAHDLRTPLTVLKGYNEMLQASDNSQTRETAATMGKHISRMENYVSSMSNLRRMEDTQPDYKLIDLQPLVSSLYDSAKIVCTKNGKELILQNDIPILQLSLDSAFISQVCNNLISNAVRYARTLVTISFALHDNGLLLSVSDDGNGFDKDSLVEDVLVLVCDRLVRHGHFVHLTFLVHARSPAAVNEPVEVKDVFHFIGLRRKAIIGVLFQIVFLGIERRQPSELQNAPISGHGGKLAGGHQLPSQPLGVLAVTFRLPTGTPLGLHGDGGLAQPVLGNFLNGTGLTATEE